MTIMIRNGLIVTQDERRRVLTGNVLVEEDTISSVGKESNKSDVVVDAVGSVVMPGLVNMHTHIGMTMLRGVCNGMNLEQFLEKTSEFDRKNTKEMIKRSAGLAAREMLKSGTTSFFDLYYSEDTIADTVSRFGLRAFLSWVVLDKEYTTQKGIPIKNAEAFVKRYRNKKMIMPSFGLQGVYVCSKDTIRQTKALSKRYNTIVHMHLAETRQEVANHTASYSLRPVEWMYRNGFLSRDLVAAHGVWVNRKETAMLARSGTTIVNNAISNAKLGSGTADIKRMLGSGINVTFGTDSAASNDSLDMFQTMKFSALMNGLTAQEALDMATVNASKALRANMGSIEKGKKADIIIVGKSASLMPLDRENAVSNVVFAAQGRDVAVSIINGKIVKNK